MNHPFPVRLRRTITRRNIAYHQAIRAREIAKNDNLKPLTASELADRICGVSENGWSHATGRHRFRCERLMQPKGDKA